MFNHANLISIRKREPNKLVDIPQGPEFKLGHEFAKKSVKDTTIIKKWQ